MPRVNRSGSRDFEWRDWWFGIYRRGFGIYLEADRQERKRARARAALVTVSLVPLAAVLFEIATWKPDPGWFHYQRGLQALASGDQDTGLSELNKAVEYSPGRLRYRLRLMWEFFKARMLAKAVEQLARVIPSRPGFVASLLLFGFVAYYSSAVLALYWSSKARSKTHSTHRL